MLIIATSLENNKHYISSKNELPLPIVRVNDFEETRYFYPITITK